MKASLIIKVTTSIFVCLLLFYLLSGVYSTYAISPWNRQSIGNYFDSERTIKSKCLEGNANCDCIAVTINVEERIIREHCNVIDSLLSNKAKINMLRHYLFGSYDPYMQVIMPKTKYESVTIEMDDSSIASKLKLTGGQVDHFNTDKYSLRLKLKDTILLEMTKFNLYDPIVRQGGLYEWVNSKLMESEGLIGLKAGYMNISLNDYNKGIYLYQEQPTIQTLISKNKPPGLIVRIEPVVVEDGSDQIEIVNYYDKKSLPSKKYAEEQNEILEAKVLSYNKGNHEMSQLISIPKMAKYLAIIDLTNGYHASEFRNIYFYFNPEDSLLEPIGREFGTNYYQPIKTSYFSFELSKFDETLSLNMRAFFQSDSFDKYYFECLKKIIKTEFLDDFFERIDAELIARQFCLYKGDPVIKSFSKNHYYENQSLIKNYLADLDLPSQMEL